MIWNNPTNTPKNNMEIVFQTYNGNVKIGIYKDEKIIDSHKNEYKMYQIKQWLKLDDWLNYFQTKKIKNKQR